MLYLNLIIYVAKLAIINTIFFTKIFFLKFQTLTTLFIITSLVLSQSYFVVDSYIYQMRTKKENSARFQIRILDTYFTDTSYLAYDINNEKGKIIKELEKINTFLTIQPTHRDLLINKAILEYHLGNKKNFHSYLNQAIVVDPNHKVLKRIRQTESFNQIQPNLNQN